jgi:hypothetical protein
MPFPPPTPFSFAPAAFLSDEGVWKVAGARGAKTMQNVMTGGRLPWPILWVW